MRTGRPKRELDLDAAQELLNRGRSLRSVANELGVSFSVLQRRLAGSSPSRQGTEIEQPSPDSDPKVETVGETEPEAPQVSPVNDAMREYLKSAPDWVRDAYRGSEFKHLLD